MLPDGLFENGYFDIDLLQADEVTMYSYDSTNSYSEGSKQHMTTELTGNPAVLVQPLESHQQIMDLNTYSGEQYQETNSVHDTESPTTELGDLDIGFAEASWRNDDPEWLPVPVTISADPQSRTMHPTITINTTTSHQPSANSRKRGVPVELDIEFDKNTKRTKRCTAPLTEEQKRIRRKELNRLAAQRCRTKRRGHSDVLEEEIEELQKKNRQLKEDLEKLSETKDQLYEIIKFHFQSCQQKTANSITSDLIKIINL